MARPPALFLLLGLIVSCHCFTTPCRRRQAFLLAPPLLSSPTAEDEPSAGASRILSIIMEEEELGDFAQKGGNDAEEEQSASAEVVPSIPENAVISPYQNTRCLKGVAARTCPLNQEVARLADIPLEEANELIDLGAVWTRMETLTEEDVLSQYNGARAGIVDTSTQYADLPKGWGSGEWSEDDGEAGQEQDLDAYIEMMSSQRYRRILTPSMVERGTDIRVYPKPRRFPACYELTRDRLLYEDTTFIVVDKPPLLPTQPDASNYEECCPGCVNELMGPFETIMGEPVARPLLCHRVDSVVGGCVVMSKDQNGQKVFNQLQRDRKLKKVYLAVTNKPVPTGLRVQWMWAPQSARGKSGGPMCQLISHAPPVSRRKARQHWTRCVLEVVKCEPINLEKSDAHGYDPGDKPHYQSTIRLVTGRKHQVRAQLASLGAPIIRDTLYGPMAGYTLDKLEDEEGNIDDAIAKCRVPTEPIGLQAHAILFGGIRAKANAPWWGDSGLE